MTPFQIAWVVGIVWICGTLFLRTDEQYHSDWFLSFIMPPLMGLFVIGVCFCVAGAIVLLTLPWWW